MISRRTVLAGAAAGLLPRVAVGAELETLRVSTIPINDVAPLYVAMKNGYFRDVGLAIDTTPSTGGAVGVPGLLGGSFDVVYANVVSALLAAAQGLDIKVVAAGTKIVAADTDASQIVVRSDSGIRSGRDLAGKSVAVNTRNGVVWLYARAWVAHTGGDPARVTFREIPFPQMDDALRQGRVDALFIVAPFSTATLGQPGVMSIGKPYTEVQPGVDVGEYLATGAFASTKADLLARFAAGLRRGCEWYNAHRNDDALFDVIAAYSRVEPAILKRAPLAPAPLHVDPTQIRRTMELMLDAKLLRTPVDISALVAPVAL